MTLNDKYFRMATKSTRNNFYSTMIYKIIMSLLQIKRLPRRRTVQLISTWEEYSNNYEA
jgi:hypothetical protein